MEGKPNSIGSSSSKTRSISDQRRDSEQVDYLSYMPFEVLIRIFSFLPMKFWIVMSLVSKRWSYFWTEMSKLEFNQPEMEDSIFKKNIWCSSCDESHRYYGSDRDCHRELRNKTTKKFLSIVDRIILFHSGCPIKNFNLSINYKSFGGYINHIGTWVDFAFTSNIESVELNFLVRRVITNKLWAFSMHKYKPYRFRESKFAPKTLKKLTLSGCLFDANMFKDLFSLESLSLMDIDICNCSIGNLHNVCPLLKTLIFERCRLPQNFMTCEEELKIEYLFLIDCRSYTLPSFPISITAPRLLGLRIIAKQLTKTNIRRAIRLIDVLVVNKGKGTDRPLGSHVDPFLRDLSHCNHLELSSKCIEVLPASDNLQLPLKFPRLRHLTLRMNMVHTEMPGLACLISCCPKLESLILNISVSHNHNLIFGNLQSALGVIEENYWETLGFDQFHNFHCMQNSLKKVHIHGFIGKTVEMKVIKLLLQNVMVLEELNISALRLGLMIIYEKYMKNTYALIDNFVKASPRAIINTSI